MVQKKEECNIVDNTEKNSYVKKQITNALLRLLKEKELKLATYKQEQDVAKAKADQAYNLESARAQQQVIEQEMQIKIIERQKQIENEMAANGDNYAKLAELQKELNEVQKALADKTERWEYLSEFVDE